MEKPKFSRFESEILDIVQLTDNVKHFKISLPKDINFQFTPGQYISIIMDDKSKNLKLRRPYSIISSKENTDEKYIELCIKILENGNITPLLDKLNLGDKIQCLGPLGEFKISSESNNKNIIFISTGVGIAPFMSMIPEILTTSNKHITLITGYKTEQDILYRNELKNLEINHKNFKHFNILSEPETGSGGRVQKLIEDNFDEGADYYICGLKEMISSVNLLLLKKGVKGKNIYLEKYD